MIRASEGGWRRKKAISGRAFSAHLQVRARVGKVVEELFPIYLSDPKQMPRHWYRDIDDAIDETALARMVSDYIAGMTDRFALQDHARLTGDHSIMI